MLKKLNLDGTRTYEIAIAAQCCATMLDNFIIGTNGLVALGSERGIETWDDLIYEDHESHFFHAQIKRNNTDFSDKDIYKREKKTGGNYDLSPLEKSLKALGEWVLNNPNDIKRHFHLYLPDGEVQLKQDIVVRNLMILCNTNINTNSTLTLFQDLISSDTSTKRIFDWLTIWCGFTDEQHVLNALKKLEIKRVGQESDIDNLSLSTLDRFFDDKNNALAIIKQFISNTSSPTSEITPKAIFHELERFLRGNIDRWTHYYDVNSNVAITGNVDGRLHEIEHSSAVVPGLWDPRLNRNIIKIGIMPNLNSKLPEAMARLTLHLHPNALGHTENIQGWKEKIDSSLGGTIGLSETDMGNIALVQSGGPKLKRGIREFSSTKDTENEALSLHQEMDNVTWAHIVKNVKAQIEQLPDSQLRTEMDSKWEIWKKELGENYQERDKLFTSFLHPTAEGKDILGKLRVGTKTAHVISKGLKYLLAIAAVYGEKASWKKLDENSGIQLLANIYWSGPAGERRRVRKLASKEGLDNLLSAEAAFALLLSETELSPDAIKNPLMAASEVVTIASAKKPKMIITGCDHFETLVKSGDMEKLKSYLKSLNT